MNSLGTLLDCHSRGTPKNGGLRTSHQCVFSFLPLPLPLTLTLSRGRWQPTSTFYADNREDVHKFRCIAVIRTYVRVRSKVEAPPRRLQAPRRRDLHPVRRPVPERRRFPRTAEADLPWRRACRVQRGLFELCQNQRLSHCAQVRYENTIPPVF